MSTNDPIIVVEIPHQHQPLVWVAKNEQDLLSKSDYVYQEWTLDSAEDSWGEESEIPEELLEILKTNVVAVQCFASDEEIKFYSKDDAPSELEVAKDAITHDLSTGFFLSVDEAKEFAVSHTGHKAIEAKIALRAVLEDYF